MVENVLFFYIFITMTICSATKVYKVGGCSGWTNTNTTPPYNSWATSKVFRVGDIIVFEYNREFHNVVRVNHTNYNRCNSTVPISIWTSGNDSFTITKAGHYYFICGFPGHCEAGQKVDIRVIGHHKPGPGPSPATFPPAQPPKSGSSSLLSSWKFWLIAVATTFCLLNK